MQRRPTELWQMGVTDMLQAFADRTTTPTEVVKGLLDRIDKVDGKVGAFRQLLSESALAEASESERRWADSPRRLEGLPIAVKEIIDVAGAHICYGSEVFAGRIATHDAEVVRRLRDHGAVIVGITRSHEFAWGITNQHRSLGSTSNPWDLNRVPGGSSGGSAAAVAAGMVPVALGTDTGGSVRIPAAFCGIAGMKPTFGSVPTSDVLPLAPSFDTVGLLTRTTRDLNPVLSVMTGKTSTPPKLDSLRIAVMRGQGEVEMDPIHAAAFTAAVERISERVSGRVFESEFPESSTVFETYKAMQMPEAYKAHSQTLGTYPGRSAEYGEDVRGRLEAASMVTPSDRTAALTEADVVRSRFANAFERGAHAVLSPASACGPSDRSSPDEVDHMGQTIPLRDAVMPHSVPQNVAGLPALSVPIAEDQSGIPISLQITATRGSEEVAILVAQAIESDLGWPPILAQ